MLKNYSHEDVKVCLTDTDSLVYSLKSSDKKLDDFIANNKDEFDLSEFDKTHKWYDSENKKVVGKMKFDIADDITRLCALRSKLYSIETKGADGKMKLKQTAKGVKKTVKDHITINDYIHTLKSQNNLCVSQQGFVSKKHQVYTYQQKKIALSCFDDKSYILPDGINTLAHGHYKIAK
jgi:hypothetical protein